MTMFSGPEIGFWANYRRGPNIAVPSPFDGDPHILWHYDVISQNASYWASQGFTTILFPNPIYGQSGAYPTGDGYNPYDDYNIGSKLVEKFGGIATRFGNAAKLRRAIAICKANGLNVLHDHVLHQRMGGDNGVYRYDSANGKGDGRFPKDPSCFRGDPKTGRVNEDPVPDVPDDFSFGDELAPINALPHDYVAQGLIAAGDWLFRTLGTDGARLDDMKGMAVEFINRWMNSKAMASKWFFGEYADGNPNDLNWYIGQTKGRMSLTDFGFHYNQAEPMCNNAGSDKWSMSNLQYNALLNSNAIKAVPFVESMDSDTDGFATIVNNKILAYALMLGGPGLPMVYMRDYMREPDCYGLELAINNLVWINHQLARGDTIWRHTSQHVAVFERTGAPGLLVALSNDVWNPNWKTVTVQTAFGPNAHLHDYTGKNQEDCWTDAQGRATFGIPPAANGEGYGCWSLADHSEPIIVKPQYITQTFFGADAVGEVAADFSFDGGLDIGGATNNSLVVGNIWCAKGTQIRLSLTVNPAYSEDYKSVLVTVNGPDGEKADENNLAEDGWHSLSVQVNSTAPLVKSIPFELEVTYMATQTLTAEQIAADLPII